MKCMIDTLFAGSQDQKLFFSIEIYNRHMVQTTIYKINTGNENYSVLSALFVIHKMRHATGARIMDTADIEQTTVHYRNFPHVIQNHKK